MCSPKAKAPDAYESVQCPRVIWRLAWHAPEKEKRALTVQSDQEKSQEMTAKLCYSSGFWYEVLHVKGYDRIFCRRLPFRHCSLRPSRATSRPLLTKPKGAPEAQTRGPGIQIVLFHQQIFTKLCCVPSTLLALGNTAVNAIGTAPDLRKFIIWL